MRAGAASLAAALLLMVSCGGDDDSPEPERPGVRGALGGSASTRTLARVPAAARPEGRAAWVAHAIELAPGSVLEHGHQPGFVLVRRGSAGVGVGGGVRELAAGEAAAVEEGRRHRIVAGDDGATVWEIRLAAPGSGPPPAAPDARRVFESPALEGIPERPAVSFIEVRLPPRGGETTVHTHPGPEFIYMMAGRIDYQNAIVGTKRLGPAGAEALPPGTAVQKRNRFDEEAVFLSWFLVDPDRPFAPGAEF